MKKNCYNCEHYNKHVLVGYDYTCKKFWSYKQVEKMKYKDYLERGKKCCVLKKEE